REYRDIGKLPVFIIVIKAVANHEFIRNLKTHVIDPDRMKLPSLLAQENSNFDRCGTQFKQMPHEVHQSLACVQNIVKQQHMTALHMGEDPRTDVKLAGPSGSAAITRCLDQADPYRHVQMTHQVGQEY